jgi:hypothetical protein
VNSEYLLRQTCHAYPERYDVVLDDKVIAEIHLRWGVLQVLYGEDEEEIYTTNKQIGSGEFDDDERNHYLNMAVSAVDHRHHNPPPPEPVFPVIENAKPMGWTMEKLP